MSQLALVRLNLFISNIRQNLPYKEVYTSFPPWEIPSLLLYYIYIYRFYK